MFDSQNRAFVAISGKEELCITPRMANRHGLITGATGTGKTVTLQTLAETFSAMGVPVFAADVKGDLSGVAAKGGNKESIVQRVEANNLAARGFAFQAFPVQFWDVFGTDGTPVRTTIADTGPLLLGSLLDLNETQSSVLAVVFKIAADEGLELIDLKDLRKTLEYVGNNASRFSASHGNLAPASVAAIQRDLLALEQQGAQHFFGEPALNVNDLIRTESGKGVINILASDKLIHSPKVYTTFLLWMATKLFTTLPEVGDQEKPKLIFFFDEAHLLFNGSSKVLVEKVEQLVRLIRSKGVGIYFISQVPSDMPDSVLGQLGNRVQHALRAYTPKDQKAIKAAAQSFRSNPAFDTEKVISELAIGEALVSFLDEKGAPRPVERAFILPPEGQVGPLDAALRAVLLRDSVYERIYRDGKDKTSAYETLNQRLEGVLNPKEQAAKAKEEAAREKAEAKARADEEKRRQAVVKEEQRATERQKKYFMDTLRSIFVPLVRQIINSFIKGGGRGRKGF